MAVHRNRVIYQSEALFISPDSTGYHFTGAKADTPIPGVGSGPFGLATPPKDRKQVFGGDTKNPLLTNNGLLAGWGQGDEWPEWNPNEEKISIAAKYDGTADSDNATVPYTITSIEVGVDSNETITGNGQDTLETLLQNAGNQYIVNGDLSLKPDNGFEIDLAGGVDHTAPVVLYNDDFIIEASTDSEDPEGGTNAQNLSIEFIDTPAQQAINVAFDVDDNGVPLITLTYNSTIHSNIELANALNDNGQAGGSIEGLLNQINSAVLNLLQNPPALPKTQFAGGDNGEFATFNDDVDVESLQVPVHIVADNAGIIGNSIEFTGDDQANITALVTAHNNANADNKVTVIEGGNVVLNENAKIALTGGENGYAKAHGSIIKQLHRVQNANYGFTVNRQDVNQFGHASRVDSIVVESPTVNLDFSYYLVDGYNERMLEFVTNGEVNCLSGALAPELYQAGNNFFILTSVEARDAVNGDVNLHNDSLEDKKSVISLGNGYITDYNVDISVGSIPTASVTVEGMNIKSDIGTTGNDLPSMDMKDGSKVSNAWDKDANGARTPKGENGCTGLYSLPATASGYEGCEGGNVAALRPGDVVVNLSNASLLHKSVSGASNQPLVGSAHVQSASVSVPMGRTTLQRLGSTFGFSKALDLPLTVTVSVSALVSDMKEDNLIDLLCSCDNYNISLDVYDPQCNDCTVKEGTKAMGFTLKGARLESENYSSSIGDNKTVDLTFSTQVGGADDMHNGLFIYGKESADGNAGLPPAWTGVNGSTEDAVSGYLFGYRG